jgi:hypothetical protein
MCLVNPLGRWTEPIPNKWEWFYSLWEERIYRQEGNDWYYYLKVRAHGHRCIQKFIASWEIYPADVPVGMLQRALVIGVTPRGLLMTGYGNIEPLHTLPEVELSLAQKLPKEIQGGNGQLNEVVFRTTAPALCIRFNRGQQLQ